MDGAILDNANAAGAYFSASLLDAKSIAGADFTDAQLPPKLLERICSKANLISINTMTQVIFSSIKAQYVNYLVIVNDEEIGAREKLCITELNRCYDLAITNALNVV